MKKLEANLRIAEEVYPLMDRLRDEFETIINLNKYQFDNLPYSVKGNAKYQRLSLMTALSIDDKRTNEYESLVMTSNSIHPTLFTVHGLAGIFNTLIHHRYAHLDVEWDDAITRSKVICFEIIKGANYLLQDNNLHRWLSHTPSINSYGGEIPHLNLHVGQYDGDIPAYIDMNSAAITNTQILVAGTTGSGKTNLLAVLMNEIRALSIETNYPVNFLFFDYKGEFADIANNHWLNHFFVDRASIIDPMADPLPFTPFKNFEGALQNEINMYSTEMADALIAIDKATISANMSNRLSEAIIDAYKKTKGKPITFKLMFDAYTELQPEKDRDKMDSVKSVLNQLIRSNIFAEEDNIDLIKESVIVKMDRFPKDGPLSKAIVYFIVSKLNSIYESLPAQVKDNDKVELKHFTIIDEAHYMLDFENKPLKELIAVGRNKGMSVILATQNMDSYKSKHFDFYANAQYPLIMRQQSINDSVIRDLYGASTPELLEIKQAIAGLQKGELIIKNNDAISLGIGKKFKKILVRHII